MKKPKPNTAKTLGDWAYLALHQHYDKMLAHEAGVFKDTDPEELHQMRVGMRRLRTAIVGFAPALDLPKAAKEKNVAKIARILGKLRDIDVLQETLKQDYQPVLPSSEQKQLNRALKTLKKERKTSFAIVQATLADKRYQKLKAGFEDWFERPHYQAMAAIGLDLVLPDLLLPQTSKLLLHPGWWIGVEFKDGEASLAQDLKPAAVERLLHDCGEFLHDLRKEAKRSRYQMELFEPFYGDTYCGYLKDIKKIQTVLGHIQDGFVLTEFLHRVLDTDLDQTMPIFAEQLRRSRYQNWQNWQALQAKFLNPSLRQNLRTTMQQPDNEGLNRASHPPDSAAKSESPPDQ
jgi:CHAD domain-containing protein